MNARTVLGLVLCLIFTGCDDSKNPLSDPQTSKTDNRLVGVWRSGDVYYHVGHAGEKFPKGVMRVVEVAHTKAGVEPPAEYLAFPTVLGDKTYLNVVIGEKQVKRLDEKGWKSDAVEYYTLLKYHFDGDTLVVWLIDEKAKELAIKDGKVKGATEKNKAARFTDTAENVARFVAGAGDSLWNTKEPGRLERVETGPPIAADEKNEQAVKKAVEAANAWLALADQGRYAEGWDTAAEYFRNAVGKEQWGKSMKAAREPLGAVKSRKVKSTEHRTKMPGAPDGEYVVIQYTTAFENKESAVETVTPMLDKDKAWRVSGYFIK